MQRRSLGASGVPVTPIGLGLAVLGRPGYINLGLADLIREAIDGRVGQDPPG